jgi:hypothetical protein
MNKTMSSVPKMHSVTVMRYGKDTDVKTAPSLFVGREPFIGMQLYVEMEQHVVYAIEYRESATVLYTRAKKIYE